MGTPLRPAHAPPLRPNQMEQYFHFAPNRWKQGDYLLSRPARDFQLKKCPGGDSDANIPAGGWGISVFVQVLPKAQWAQGWKLENCSFRIKCVPWQERKPHLEFQHDDVITFC